MFDIGFPELLIVTVVMLLVLGPERLPETLRTLGLWLGRLRRSFNAVKMEIEKEVGMDEIKRQLHNEGIMEEMKRLESEVHGSVAGLAPQERSPATDTARDNSTVTEPATASANTDTVDTSPATANEGTTANEGADANEGAPAHKPGAANRS